MKILIVAFRIGDISFIEYLQKQQLLPESGVT